MKDIRAIKEISEKMPEFEYNPESEDQELVCIVCSTNFSYSSSLQQEFICGKVMTEKFRNLKKNLLSHLTSATHSKRTGQKKHFGRRRRRETGRLVKPLAGLYTILFTLAVLIQILQLLSICHVQEERSGLTW